MPRLALCLLLAVVLDAPGIAQVEAPLRVRMLRAEDARGRGVEGLAPFDEGLRDRAPEVRRQAVRALGRLERADLIARVAPVAEDPDARVQREAIDALGQLAREPAAIAEVQALLLVLEPRVDAPTWAVLAATLGRLPYQDAGRARRAERTLVRVLPGGPDRSRGVDGLIGAARGLEALVRQSRAIAPPLPGTIDGLRRLATAEAPGARDVVRLAADEEAGERLAAARRLAWLALAAADGADAATVAAGLDDSDEEVRRVAASAAGGDAVVEGRGDLLRSALHDASPRVRYEALRTWGRRLQVETCAPVTAALADEDPHVRLLAVDLLGGGCPDAESPVEALRRIAGALDQARWHAPAHAIVALAHVAPSEARTLLPRFLASERWQVRMYAARAAGVLADIEALERLAVDAHDNVREAALAALADAKRAEAVAPALDDLARRDYQLVMTAARALSLADPEQRAPAVAALLAALDRISAERRDTSRDPRMALLDRLQALGGRADAARIEPYLRDPDPLVAAKAAEVLQALTGVTRVADPRPLPIPPVDAAAVDALPRTTLRVTVAGRGTFTLRLFADEAPLSALRVVTRAREGYYDGLTFHRVAANFVIQGGSPGANEYMGDGPYMRDEVGLLSHRRGTVGVSTRGRDTGDAQIFVNLVDSPRLDHVYTVFAEVVEGMDVVDSVLEGDVIERVEVRTGA